MVQRVLSGGWRKDQAAYIGEGAREAARRTRIRLLERELDDERAAVGAIDANLADVGTRRDLLAGEHRTVPSDDGVREAHTMAAGERRRRAELRADHAEAVALCGQREGELAGARERAAEFADDVGLPADTAELAAVREGLGAYRVALAALWPAAEAAHAAIRAAADAETELADSRQLLLEASERAAEARDAAGAAATTYQELLATAGTRGSTGSGTSSGRRSTRDPPPTGLWWAHSCSSGSPPSTPTIRRPAGPRR